MSFFINPVEEDQCVFLSYEGELPPIEVVAARYEAIALLAQRRWNRVVVDVTQLGSVTERDLPKFAQGLTSDLPCRVRVALVVRPEQSKYARLIEDFARNNGVRLTFFSDLEDAIRWVKGIRPSEQLKSPLIGTDESVRLNIFLTRT